MRKIDGDELLEVLMRSDVSSREKIAEIVRQQPEVKDRALKKLERNFRKLSNEHMSTADYHMGKAHAYAIAADIILLEMEEGDSDSG